MAFDDLKKDEIIQIAEDFGVDLEGATNNEARVALIIDSGVTWEMYETFKNASIDDDLVENGQEPDDDDAGEAAEKKEYLVKMERKNGTYSYWGVTFKREHPFKLVDEATLEALIEHGGFRQALPREAEEFYK